MSVEIEEIKQVLSQYGIVKSNDEVNEAVIDRVARIIYKEFEVTIKNPFKLDCDLVDISAAVKDARRASLSRPRESSSSGSSENAPVAAGEDQEGDSPEQSEEKVVEVEAKRELHPTAPQPAQEVLPSKPVEGQRASSSPQQKHFQSEIGKHLAKVPDVAKRSGALPPDFEEVMNEAFEDKIEVAEGEDFVVDPKDTDVGDMFEDGEIKVTNPKDAVALQNSLPKKLDSVEPRKKGKSKSITRIQ